MDWTQIGSSLVGVLGGVVSVLVTLGSTRVRRRIGFVYESESASGAQQHQPTQQQHLQALTRKPGASEEESGIISPSEIEPEGEGGSPESRGSRWKIEDEEQNDSEKLQVLKEELAELDERRIQQRGELLRLRNTSDTERFDEKVKTWTRLCILILRKQLDAVDLDELTIQIDSIHRWARVFCRITESEKYEQQKLDSLVRSHILRSWARIVFQALKWKNGKEAAIQTIGGSVRIQETQTDKVVDTKEEGVTAYYAERCIEHLVDAETQTSAWGAARNWEIIIFRVRKLSWLRRLKSQLADHLRQYDGLYPQRSSSSSTGSP